MCVLTTNNYPLLHRGGPPRLARPILTPLSLAPLCPLVPQLLVRSVLVRVHARFDVGGGRIIINGVPVRLHHLCIAAKRPHFATRTQVSSPLLCVPARHPRPRRRSVYCQLGTRRLVVVTGAPRYRRRRLRPEPPTIFKHACLAHALCLCLSIDAGCYCSTHKCTPNAAHGLPSADLAFKCKCVYIT